MTRRASARIQLIVDGSANCGSGTPSGSVRVPALLTDGMLDGVVWLPTNSRDCSVRTDLGTDAGGRVAVTKGGAA